MSYFAPTPIDKDIENRATIEEFGERKTRVKSRVFSDDVQPAEGEVIAIRIPDFWKDANSFNRDSNRHALTIVESGPAERPQSVR